MTKSAELPDLSPLPTRPCCHFRTGVSGHPLHSDRAFDIDVVHGAMVTVFKDIEAWLVGLQSSSFSCDTREISLISALADGADQMAVKAFYESQAPAGVRRRLEAVLPFATDAYAGTFHTADDAARMRSQLESADSVLVLADWSPGSGGKSSPFTSHWREQRYATVGDIIVRQSDLLLAVWDGMTGSGPGGTAHVVAHAVAERVPVVSIHPKTGALRLITRRAFSGLNADDVISNDLFLAYDRLAKDYSAERLGLILTEIVSPPAVGLDTRSDGLEAFFLREPVRATTRAALYNCLFSAPASERGAASPNIGAQSGKPLPHLSIATDHVRKGLQSPAWRDIGRLSGSGNLFRDFAKAWAHADAVATRLGHHYRSTYVAIFCVAALATLSGLMGLPMTLLGADEKYFVLAEFLILCAGLGIYWSGRVAQQHQRWLNARELSEQMRAHWALGLIGLGGRRSVGDASRWTSWLFNAYAAPVGVPDLSADTAALTRIAEVIRVEIVQDQANYHKKNERILDFNHKKLEIIGNLSLLLAMASSIALIIYLIYEHHFENDLFRLGMIAASAALPSIGAAATGIRFQGDFERFAWRSGQTHAALMRIDRQLDQFITGARGADADRPHFEDLRDIVTRLEQVLLSDLDDWRFVYEARPDPGVG
jgi:hypothetical protein